MMERLKTETKSIKANNLKNFCKEAFIHAGVPGSDASLMAYVLVEADLRGNESHGTMLLSKFVDALLTGKLNPHANIKVTRETRSTAVINGDNSACGLAAYKAMDMAIKKAKDFSLGAAAVRNVGQCGALASFTTLAVEHNMIGFMTAQGRASVPPFGGKTRLLNTSPWSFAIPAGKELPIVLDMASTVVSHNEIALAAMKKEKIPSTWLLDKDGKPTDDPADADTGFQSWIGGYKGYGLAVVDQVLAGILGSGSFIGSVFPDSETFRRGHFVMAIDVESFMPVKEFTSQVDKFIKKLKASERVEGVAEILLPGERGGKLKQERLQSGIPIIMPVWKQFEKMGKELNINID